MNSDQITVLQRMRMIEVETARIRKALEQPCTPYMQAKLDGLLLELDAEYRGLQERILVGKRAFFGGGVFALALLPFLAVLLAVLR